MLRFKHYLSSKLDNLGNTLFAGYQLSWWSAQGGTCFLLLSGTDTHALRPTAFDLTVENTANSGWMHTGEGKLPSSAADIVTDFATSLHISE